MSTARRITPAEVLAAGERHPEIGLTSGTWFVHLAVGCRTCPLGLLAIDAGVEPSKVGKYGELIVRRGLRLDAAYVGGFCAGVDGDDYDGVADAPSGRILAGFLDGRAVAAAVFGKGATR